MAETWHYLENQFDNVTKGSRKQMQVITNDHNSRLVAQSGDVDIDGLIARYGPVHQDFLNKYSSWMNADAFHQSTTVGVNKLLNELSGTKIRQWDSAITIQYDVGTEEYMHLLPNRRTPFQTGGMDQRISEVKSLATRLNTYAPLATLQGQVNTFHGLIKGARDNQQQKEQLVESTANQIETARVVLAIMLYRNLGVLMDKYGLTPEVIATFWELKNLRRGAIAEVQPTEPITGPVPGNGSVMAKDGGFDENSTFILRSIGANLVFCTSDTSGAPCTQGVQVLDGGEATVQAPELGMPIGRYLNVTSISTEDGSYELVIG